MKVLFNYSKDSINQMNEFSEIINTFESIIGDKVEKITCISSGRNSRAYCVISENLKKMLIKFYHSHDDDKRDRLNTEFLAFEFLWKNGIYSIPKPIAIDKKNKCAIYHFIEGRRMLMDNISDSDIDAGVTFLSLLKKISLNHEAQFLPNASESCFCLTNIIDNINQRLNRFNKVINYNDVQFEKLSQFIDNQFKPFFKDVTNWCQSNFLKFGMNPKEILTDNYRTLSPSDFGFHNAIKQENGEIVFIDFEYFGWDDPAKMICDFLLNPAILLNNALKNYFYTSISKNFKEDKLLKTRVEIFFPLFGLKWCLILLNEFIPADLQRRKFAEDSVNIDLNKLHSQQMAKALNMFTMVKNEYKKFPYC